ncbi:MAG: PDZ domain-containing protein, partial [Acidimicrobiia bacterium]
MHEESTDESSEEPSDAAVSPPGPRPPGPSRGRRIAAIALSAIGVLIVVVVVAGFFIHLPYVIISPGSATPLDDSVVTIEGAPTYGHEGNVLFLTVRVTPHDPNLWKYLVAKLDPDKEVVKRENVLGCLSDNDNAAFNTLLMSQSQDDATKVALERLGYTVTASSPVVTVTTVCPDSPAFGALHSGDAIVAVDGQPVTANSSIADLLAIHAPGDAVPVTVNRGGADVTIAATTGRRVVTPASGAESGGAGSETECVPTRGQPTGTPCFGIVVQQFVRYEFPIDVNFDIQRVGGPSAGLAFTLAIIDDLTPGDITGGKRVAVTGAIAADGSVLPVGGVEQKAITARHNDVDLMLVPRSELAAARKGANGLRVVGVDTFDEALAALQKAG